MCVCFSEIMWLVITKMRLKIKNGSYSYNINRTNPRDGHKYAKYKMYLSMAMVMCNKQHLSNIWSWIHRKVRQHWGWVEKKNAAYKKGK